MQALTLRRAFVALFAADLFCTGVRTTLDPDMWWHLRTGEYIWQAGIPRHDMFSFTMRGHDWFAHEWLSELLMWGIYQVSGFTGLSLSFAAVTAVAFWLVYKCSAAQPYLAAAVVLLGTAAAAPTFGARPQTFTILFAAVFVYMVERLKSGRLPRRALLLLPFVTIVWANLHSGFLLGVVLLVMYAVGGALELLSGTSDGRSLAWSDVRLLAGLAIACFLVAGLNPHGWHLWTYPFGTLGSQAMQQNIAEWHSPDFHRWVYWPFAAMIGLGVIGFARGKVRPAWTDLLLFLGTAAAGLISLRHIPFFAIAASPIISRSLFSLVPRTGRAYRLLSDAPHEPVPSRVLVAVNRALLVMGLLVAAVWVQARLAGNQAAIVSTYPVGAVDFIQRQGLAGARGFNAYEWGGYLIWRGIPVFVDGRADVYGDFLSSYLETSTLNDNWRKPLDELDVVYVLIQRSHPLGTLLAASGQWREVYADDVARVFTRERS